ncbi:MAG: PEP-CTERM sorting domain-containing protein [Akkermansiaceae bacterium]
MKKTFNFKSSALLAACVVGVSSMAQAALTLAVVDNAAAVDDSSGVDFSGQILTTSIDNWGRNDNFSNATLTNVIFNFNGGNQPFLNTDISGADFSGATFNWDVFVINGDHRVNMFRGLTGIDGASFVDTIWNIDLSEDSIGNADFFNNGSGITTGVDFSGADFNFSGTDTSLADDIGGLLITNLGTGVGAVYDDAFVTNNFADFGFADEAALETALDGAGWQAVPEPSSTALLGLGALGMLVHRRRAQR